VLEHYGLPPAQAFKLFLKQIADTQTVPLSFDHHANRIPNAVTRRALEESIAERENPTAKRYTLNHPSPGGGGPGWDSLANRAVESGNFYYPAHLHTPERSMCM